MDAAGHIEMRSEGRVLPYVFLLAVALAEVGLSPARADVTGVTADVQGGRGQTVVAEMRLSAGGAVDGINGELMYDPTILSNPRVSFGLGSMDYTAMGHVVDPGDAISSGTFRFLLYKKSGDGTLSLRRPVILFLFDVVGSGDPGTMVTFTASQSAAARIVSDTAVEVVSIGQGGAGGNPPPETVTFEPFWISTPTAVRSWERYDKQVK